MTKRQVFLASQSPRRHEILTNAGIPFIGIPNRLLHESPCPKDRTPKEWVLELARQKVMASKSNYEGLIIGSDTMVVCQGQLLGKPVNETVALSHLNKLNGRCHDVITGVVMWDTIQSKMHESVECAEVYFNHRSQDELRDYIREYEVLDKAGAYGIQHKESGLIQKINGSYFTVMGLPLDSIYRFLMNYDILEV